MRFSKRVTLRRRHSYSTKSNRTVVVKTPGSRLTVHYLHKVPKAPVCGSCHRLLHGLPAMRNVESKNASRCHKTISRVYGGHLCAHCVRERIVRAFLIEEQKQAQKVVAKKVVVKAAEPVEKKAAKKSSKKTEKKTTDKKSKKTTKKN
ncbi:hypothetical protein WA158_005259 [Blastocystis sp. Blastoise]